MKPQTADSPNSRSLIQQGDCLQLFKSIGDDSVPLVFADPPYNIGINYGQGKRADQLSDLDYCQWCRKWLAEIHRVLTPAGTAWLLIGTEYACELGCLAKEVGLVRASHVIWYESFSVCNNAKTNFSRSHRHLFRLTKTRRCVFNYQAIMVPSDRQLKYNDKRANPDGKIMNDVWLDIPRLCGTHKERIKGFPTQLPLKLLERVIACSSNPNDLVLDPFCGSGTTGAAALKLGRRFLGFELSSDYANKATKRLEALRAVEAFRGVQDE